MCKKMCTVQYGAVHTFYRYDTYSTRVHVPYVRPAGIDKFSILYYSFNRHLPDKIRKTCAALLRGRAMTQIL